MSNSISSTHHHEKISPPSVDQDTEKAECSVMAYQYVYQCLTKEENKFQKTEETLQIPKEDPEKERKENYFYCAYAAMMENLQCHQSLFKVSAKLIQHNADFQQLLTKQQAEMRYIEIPKDAKMDKISDVQRENQQIDADRAKLQGQVAILRQTASLSTAKVSSDVQSMNCVVTEIAGLQEKTNSTIESVAQMGKK